MSQLAVEELVLDELVIVVDLVMVELVVVDEVVLGELEVVLLNRLDELEAIDLVDDCVDVSTPCVVLLIAELLETLVLVAVKVDVVTDGLRLLAELITGGVGEAIGPITIVAPISAQGVACAVIARQMPPSEK